jgi:hypothetical protein
MEMERSEKRGQDGKWQQHGRSGLPLFFHQRSRFKTIFFHKTPAYASTRVEAKSAWRESRDTPGSEKTYRMEEIG